MDIEWDHVRTRAESFFRWYVAEVFPPAHWYWIYYPAEDGTRTHGEEWFQSPSSAAGIDPPDRRRDAEYARNKARELDALAVAYIAPGYLPDEAGDRIEDGKPVIGRGRPVIGMELLLADGRANVLTADRPGGPGATLALEWMREVPHWGIQVSRILTWNEQMQDIQTVIDRHLTKGSGR